MTRVKTSDLSVGQFAERGGVPVSTVHYYEAEGLIQSWRTPANHRRYDRSELRRLAIIRVAQTVGIPLAEIRSYLNAVPRGKAVTRKDWEAASAMWSERLDDRIALLTRLRDQLGHCIGCGCLSLKSCPLYNPDDELGKAGAGPQRWMANPD